MVNESKQYLNKENYNKLSVSPEIQEILEIPKCNLPSVTNILNITMSEQSKAALENWKKSMIEKLGEDGFNLYSRGKIKRENINFNRIHGLDIFHEGYTILIYIINFMN